MLTQEDLQALNTLLAASEERMKNYVDAALSRELSASEKRTQNHMNAVIETQVIPQIKQVADGVIQANDRLERVETRLDSLEETVTAHEWYIVRKAAEN